MTTATMAATMFLKKAFCMVGTSPDMRTKTDIREKKKAAIRIKRIPFLLLLALSSVLTVFDLFFGFSCPAAVIVLIFSLLTGLNKTG
jgi:hypothetical protein